MARVKIIHEHDEQIQTRTKKPDSEKVFRIRERNSNNSKLDYKEPKLLSKPELQKQRQLAIEERVASEKAEKEKNKIRLSWDMSVGRHIAAIFLFILMFAAPVTILENWQQIQFATGMNSRPFSTVFVNQEANLDNQNNSQTGRVAGIQSVNNNSQSQDQTFADRLQSRMGLILIVIGIGMLSISAVIYLNVMGVI